MSEKFASLSDLTSKLRDLKSKKEAGSEMGSTDTSHPSKSVDNNTTDGNLEGARSAENTSDNKQEQPIGVEDSGSPDVKEPAGSQGVEAKEPEDKADMDTGDTSGVSEMANTDTSHPSKSASDLLTVIDEAIKTASEEKPEEKAPEAKTDEPEKKADEEVDDEAKLAAYAEKIASEHNEAFEEGFKFAGAIFEQLVDAQSKLEGADAKTAADAKSVVAALKQAMGEELPPELMGAAGGAPAPEMGGAPAAPEMGGEEMLGEEDQLAALEQALAEAGVTPEELAAAIAAEGGEGEAPAPEMGGAPAAPAPEAGMEEEMAEEAKAASDAKAQKIAALKDQLVAELKTIKTK